MCPCCLSPQVNYWPSKVENVAEVAQPQYGKTFVSKEPISGHRVKEDLYVGDDYVQAGDRIRSMDQGRCGSRHRCFAQHVLPSYARLVSSLCFIAYACGVWRSLGVAASLSTLIRAKEASIFSSGRGCCWSVLHWWHGGRL